MLQLRMPKSALRRLVGANGDIWIGEDNTYNNMVSVRYVDRYGTDTLPARDHQILLHPFEITATPSRETHLMIDIVERWLSNAVVMFPTSDPVASVHRLPCRVDPHNGCDICHAGKGLPSCKKTDHVVFTTVVSTQAEIDAVAAKIVEANQLARQYLVICPLREALDLSELLWCFKACA